MARKRLGILTGGGAVAGLNAINQSAPEYGIEIGWRKGPSRQRPAPFIKVRR